MLAKNKNMPADEQNTPHLTTYDHGIAHDGDVGIIVEMNTKRSPELADMGIAFTSIVNHYHRFCVLKGIPYDKNRIFISSIHPGSFWIHLLTEEANALLSAGIDSIISAIAKDFVLYLRGRISPFSEPGEPIPDTTKSELKDIMGFVHTIAKDPDSSQSMRSVIYTHDREDGSVKERTTAEFIFNSSEACAIVEKTERQVEKTGSESIEEVQNVAMDLKRIDRDDAKLDQPSGEYAVVRSIASNDLRLIYGTLKARTIIKMHIHDADGNPLYKTFRVDLQVIWRNRKRWAYKVTHVHEVINSLPVKEPTLFDS